MKRKIKYGSGIWEYLNQSGVLDTGTNEEINQARKDYWKLYKATWRKQKRASEKELTISFTKAEYQLLTASAKQHKRSNSQFFKESSFAYIQKRYVVPDVWAISQIRQLLALNYNVTKDLMDENHLKYKVANILKEKLTLLEYSVNKQLEQPKTLEETVKEAIINNPHYKTIIQKVLDSVV